MAVVTNAVSTGGLIITISNPPESPTSPGAPGQIAWDSDFIYICIAPDVWSRNSHSVDWIN